jgi:hypothetical protein
MGKHLFRRLKREFLWTIRVHDLRLLALVSKYPTKQDMPRHLDHGSHQVFLRCEHFHIPERKKSATAIRSNYLIQAWFRKDGLSVWSPRISLRWLKEIVNNKHEAKRK